MKFYSTEKWYIHRVEYVWASETHTILLDLEIQTNHQITARMLVLELINKIKKKLSTDIYRHSENKEK